MKLTASNTYLLAASLLEAAADGAPEPGLLRICAASLREFAEHETRYRNASEKVLRFEEEAKQHIASICLAKAASPDILHDKAFELVECLAILMRACALAKSTQQMLPAQGELLSYFEKCGHWEQGDGTLVSDVYYNRLH